MRRGRWSGGLRALGRGRRMRRRRRSAYGVRRLARLSAALVWRLSSGRRLGRMLRRGWGSFTAMPGFVRAGPGLSIERAERLEQLRALEHGIRIKAVETPYDSLSVDTPDDLEAVRRLLSAPASG